MSRSDDDSRGAGRLFVISGPSGVGKGTVVRRLLGLVPDVIVSVSCTTRPPRTGEVDGRDYRFVSPEEFDRLIGAGAFLEWAEIYGHHRSGTLAAPVDEEISRGRNVVLEIDVQGAEQIRARRPDALLVFLQPPSAHELARRLRERGTESDAELERRQAAAEGEIARASEFDVQIVNDDADRAAEEIAAIIAGRSEDRVPRPRDTGRRAPEGDNIQDG